MKDVIIEVISQNGFCGYGHGVGHKWICDGKTPAGMCAAAFAAIYPTVRAVASGGSFPWGNGDGSIDLVCPDPANPVVFRLRVKD